MNRTRHRVAVGLGMLLAAFFLFGAWGNLFLSPDNRGAYLRWGYPEGFNYLTAALEGLAAVLLLRWRTLPHGAALASCIMAAAAATTIYHGEYDYSIAPLTVLAVALIALALGRLREI